MIPQPQMPSQGMGSFQQAAQSPQSGQPPMQGGQPPQGSAPQQGPQPMDPRVILQMIQTLPPQMQQMLAQHVLQSAASQGRGGDSLIAHLTPGEKTVPPEVQTPKVLATLNKAYKEKGVQPQQFTAGTPQSSHNPSTGLPEYNFQSAFLPAAMGMAGALLAPETGGLSLAASSAIGGGLGSAAGGLLTGQSPTQAALSGIGSAAGGYALSGMGGAAGGAAGDASKAALTTAQSAVMGAKDPAAAYAAGGQMGLNMSSPASTSAMDVGTQRALQASGSFTPTPALSNLWGTLPAGSINPAQSAGSMAGGYIGGMLGAPPKSNSPNYPAGFNNPMDPVGSKGSAQQQLGMNNSNQPMPSFSGFNPATNNPAAYNFYPTR